MVLGRGRRHALDPGGLARPVKTSGIERPPSEKKEIIAAAESETGTESRAESRAESETGIHPLKYPPTRSTSNEIA